MSDFVEFWTFLQMFKIGRNSVNEYIFWDLHSLANQKNSFK